MGGVNNVNVLERFLIESLMIEGIDRKPTDAEIGSTSLFLDEPLSVESVMVIQEVYAPGMPIRDKNGMNVRVGRHICPPGDISMPASLRSVLTIPDPWKCHVEFELLHPFMDGNGRTGRAVWAWKMIRAGDDPFTLGFLHRFYYQTLSAQR